MSGHTEYLEKKLDDEIKILNETIRNLCDENTNMQRDIIRREKELLCTISNMLASPVFKRAFNEKERTALEKTLLKKELCIGNSQQMLNDLKERIEKGIKKRLEKENEHLIEMGINAPELSLYKKLFSSEVFIEYYQLRASEKKSVKNQLTVVE